MGCIRISPTLQPVLPLHSTRKLRCHNFRSVATPLNQYGFRFISENFYKRGFSTRAALVSSIAQPSMDNAPRTATVPSPVAPMPVSHLYPRNERPRTINERWKLCFVDKFGRSHDYLRISLTERCNLRCHYCMPPEGVALSPPEHHLTADEIIRFSTICANAGVSKIRLTGGEPTLRKEFDAIVKGIGEIPGLSVFAMTTNGIALERHFSMIKESRMNSINISLDTLIPDRFSMITKRNGFNKVWKSINRVLEEKFCQLKINCVVMKGVNEDELCNFVDLTRNMPIEVRFIEHMPFAKNGWSEGGMLRKKEMLEIILNEFPDIQQIPISSSETAEMYQVPGHEGYVGFIASMSQMFCGTCNRLRLTADGNLKNCLFSLKEHTIRDLLRKNETDEELMNQIYECISSKAKNHGGWESLAASMDLKRPMIKIGG